MVGTVRCGVAKISDNNELVANTKTNEVAYWIMSASGGIMSLVLEPNSAFPGGPDVEDGRDGSGMPRSMAPHDEAVKRSRNACGSGFPLRRSKEKGKMCCGESGAVRGGKHPDEREGGGRYGSPCTKKLPRPPPVRYQKGRTSRIQGRLGSARRHGHHAEARNAPDGTRGSCDRKRSSSCVLATPGWAKGERLKGKG